MKIEFIIVFAIMFLSTKPVDDPVFKDQFTDLENWKIEAQSPETKVIATNNEMEIITPRGVTIWYKEKLKGDIKISYQAKVINQDGPYDRVSDLNCFWMATDPKHPDDFFARSDWRGGSFGKYYSLKLYYVGLGGHDNTKTRFRKYDGDYQAYENEGKRPEVITEYTEPKYLIIPNQWHEIEIVVQNNQVKYSYNGEILINHEDDEPYRSGYFGFRTVNNHMKIRNFKISEL